jgi:hypothetical protein
VPGASTHEHLAAHLQRGLVVVTSTSGKVRPKDSTVLKLLVVTFPSRPIVTRIHPSKVDRRRSGEGSRL